MLKPTKTFTAPNGAELPIYKQNDFAAERFFPAEKKSPEILALEMVAGTSDRELELQNEIFTLKNKIAALEQQTQHAPKPVPLVFAERFQLAMSQKKMTLNQVSQLAGINSGTLNHVKDGCRALKIPDAAAVADVLDVSLDWLCGRAEK